MSKTKLQRNLSLVLAITLMTPTVTAFPVFADIPENGVEARDEKEVSIEDKFEDKNLVELIKEQLKVSQITNKNIFTLEELNLEKLNYNYQQQPLGLKGLENAINLRKIDGLGIKIKDLTPLKDLPYFEELSLRFNGLGKWNQIENWNSLLELKNLKRLTLQNNAQITSLDKIKTLTNLEKLDVRESNLDSLDGLNNFPKLKYLDITLTNVQTIDALINSSQTLEHLGIGRLKLKNIDVLANLVKLKTLEMYGSEIYSLKPIENLVDLEELYLGSITEQYDLVKYQQNLENNKQIIGKFKKLKKLDASYINSRDLDYISNLSNLEVLYIYSTDLEDIQGIENLNRLREVYLDNNQIKVIPNLNNIKTLEELHLQNNHIQHLAPFNNLANLKKVDLSNNQIEDLNCFDKIESLTSLNASYNNLNNIDGLAKSENLEELDLSFNNIKNIEAITNHKKLRDLVLSNNQIEEIENKNNLWPNIQNLKLLENKLKDFRFTNNWERSFSYPYIEIYDNNHVYNLTNKRYQELVRPGNNIKFKILTDEGESEITEKKVEFNIKDGVLQLTNAYSGDKIELSYYGTYLVHDKWSGEDIDMEEQYGTISIDTSNLKPAQALNYTPKPILLQVEKDSKKVDYKKGILNLPEGAEVTPLEGENPDLTKLGKQTVKVKITLEDGSYLETEIPIEVKITPTEIKPIEEIAKENIEPEIIKVGDKIDLTDNIKNLPDGTQVKDITNPPIDTTKPGKYTATVEITYKDDSGTTVEIPVEIKELEANTYNPEITVPKIEVKTGEKVNIADLIEKTPEIKEIIEIKPIDTETEGIKEGLVKIIFNDGSEKEIPIKVEIKLKDKLLDKPVLPNNPETPVNPEITTPIIPYKPIEDTFHYGEIKIIEHTDTQKPKEKETSKQEVKDDKSELDKIKADLEKEDKKITKKNQIIFKIGETSYKKIIAGKEELKQMDIAPFIDKDRTYLPIRNVAEAIGLEVSYDNNTRTATFKQNNDILQIKIDTKKATKNGKPYEMEVTPLLENDRLVAPISVIGKAFNKTVSTRTENKKTDIVWNNDTKEVIIYNYK